MTSINSGRIDYRVDGIRKSLEFEFGKNIGVDEVEIYFCGEKVPDGYHSSIRMIPKKPITIIDAYVDVNLHYDYEDRIMVNGYQSWTASGELTVREKYAGLRRVFAPVIKHYQLDHYGDSTFYRYSNRAGCFHSYTFTYVRKGESPFVRFFGSLSERNGFTVFETDPKRSRLHIRKECEGLRLETDTELFSLIESSGDIESVFNGYFHEMDLPPLPDKHFTGWTSWYHYYEKITEEIILENLANFRKNAVSIDVFQIDDGYQAAVGDWLIPNAKFPNGMKPIAEAVKNAGFIPGLWLAPFICEESSALLRDHPDWVVKDNDERFIPIGYNPFNWSGNYYGLDVYHPEVRNYLRDVFRTVIEEWGFSMVKLDFLHSACFTPHDGKPRGRIISDAMDFVRECVGSSAYILGCGMPLGGGMGKTDFCRIGSDVSLGWEDNRLKLLRYRERVSTANSLTSTVGRYPLNGRAFLNDPDVFFLRSENIYQTADQKFTLYALNLIFGGLVFTSDNISTYDSNQMRLYRSHFPHLPKTIRNVVRRGETLRVEFGIGNRNYIALSNLSDQKTSVESLSDHWYEGGELITGTGTLILQPYQTRIIAPISYQPFTVAGTDGHIFPAGEITRFEISPDNIEIEFYPNGVSPIEAIILVPEHTEAYSVNGKRCVSERWKDLTFIRYRYEREV